MRTCAIVLAVGTALVEVGCGPETGTGVVRDQPSTTSQATAGPRAAPESQPPSGSGTAAPSSLPAPAPANPANPAVTAEHPGAPAAPGASAPPAPGLHADLPAALPNAPPSQHADTSAERDQRIALEVRAGLSHDAHVARDTRNVQVTAVDGVVILTGTVSSDADRHAIRSQAERVSGVVRVEDQLVVR